VDREHDGISAGVDASGRRFAGGVNDLRGEKADGEVIADDDVVRGGRVNVTIA
jgi:hypothetical protein